MKKVMLALTLIIGTIALQAKDYVITSFHSPQEYIQKAKGDNFSFTEPVLWVEIIHGENKILERTDGQSISGNKVDFHFNKKVIPNIFIIYYILQLAAKYNVLLRVESQYTDKTLLKSPYLFHLFIRKNWSSIFIPFNLHQMRMTIRIIQWISYNFCFCSCMINHNIITIFILGKGIMSRTVNTF